MKKNNKRNRRHIKSIRWYTTLIPYIYMLDLLRYNTRNGNVTYNSFIIIDNKYVKSDNEYNETEQNKKFKIGRPTN